MNYDICIIIFNKYYNSLCTDVHKMNKMATCIIIIINELKDNGNNIKLTLQFLDISIWTLIFLLNYVYIMNTKIIQSLTNCIMNISLFWIIKY